MDRHRPRARSTLAAAALMGLVSLAFVVYAVSALAVAGDTGVVASRDAVLLGLSGREEGVATAIVGGVILAVSLLTLTMTVGVLRRREGARHAALATFGVLGFLALAASVPGLLATPPRPGAPFGLLTGLVDAAVVALLLLPTTADDVDAAERARERTAVRR